MVRRSTRSGSPFHPLWSAVPPVLVRRSTRAGPPFHPRWSAVPPVLAERKLPFFLMVERKQFEHAPLKTAGFCLQNAKIALNGAQSPRGLRKKRGFAAQNADFCAKSAPPKKLRLRAKIYSLSWRSATTPKTSKIPLCVLVRRSTRSGPLSHPFWPAVPPVLVRRSTPLARRSTRSGPPFHPFGPPFHPFGPPVPPLSTDMPPSWTGVSRPNGLVFRRASRR